MTDITTVTDTTRRMAHTLSASQARMLLALADGQTIDPNDHNARHMLVERCLITKVELLPDGTLTDLEVTPAGHEVVALLRPHFTATPPPDAETPVKNGPDFDVGAAKNMPENDTEVAATATPDPSAVKLAAAEREIALLREQLMAASTRQFREGQATRALEKRVLEQAEKLEASERLAGQVAAQVAAFREQAETQAALLAAAKAQDEQQRQRIAMLEKRLAGAAHVEYDIIRSASPEDLRVAELAGWAFQHMQFDAAGNLNVVLRRAPQQSPTRRDQQRAAHRDRAARWQTTRAGTPPAAPTSAASDHATDPGDMVVIGIDDPPQPARAARVAAPSSAGDLMAVFTTNLQQRLAETPLPQSRPLSDYTRL